MEQVNKERFYKRPNPWLCPIKENQEFPDSMGQTYPTSDTLVTKVKKQLKKKKPNKADKVDRIAEKSLLLSAKLGKKGI